MSGGSIGRNENSLFTSSNSPPFPLVTDLQGFQIHSISLVVNSVTLDSTPLAVGAILDADLAVQVPEPATFVLIALGGLMILAYCRRR